MNSDSVIENQEMMVPRAHHSQPPNRPTSTRGQRDPEDTGTVASLDHPVPSQTGQERANDPLGSGTDEVQDEGPNGSGVRITAPPTDNRAGVRPIHITLMLWYFTMKYAKGVNEFL